MRALLLFCCTPDAIDAVLLAAPRRASLTSAPRFFIPLREEPFDMTTAIQTLQDIRPARAGGMPCMRLALAFGMDVRLAAGHSQ
jgi:hypothetical protein